MTDADINDIIALVGKFGREYVSDASRIRMLLRDAGEDGSDLTTTARAVLAGMTAQQARDYVRCREYYPADGWRDHPNVVARACALQAECARLLTEGSTTDAR